jgi:hypothetical protein
MGFFAAFLTVALAGAPPARALSSYGSQHPIPNITAAGGCGALCHDTGYLDSPLWIDFVAAGEVWNAQFANADSDGDGFSNGWELQNPSASWKAGDAEPGSAAKVANPVQLLDVPPLPVATVPTAPTAIAHTESAGQNGSEGFTVKNVGGVPFDYSITSSDVWMTPDSPAGPLPAGQQDDLLLSFATNGLIDGLYQGDLTIAIAGINPSLIPLVLVDLTVPEPSAMLAGGGALLSLGLLARRRVGGVRAPRT